MNGRALVFAAGEMASVEGVAALCREGDLVVAADGGARHALACGLTPQLVVGDLDSLNESEIDELQARGVEIVRHPNEKDETDLELALDAVRERGAAEVLLFAALGGRKDHELANLMLMASPAYRGASILAVDGALRIHAVRGGEELEIHGRRGQLVSLLPAQGSCHGVRSTGLAYPLEDEKLCCGSPRGVSNILEKERATLTLREGTLLCYHFSE